MQATAQLTENNLGLQPTQSEAFASFQAIIEHEFPLEFLLAGELAQFETFISPSISSLLHRTRQYEEAGLKRLDDTKATMYGIFKYAPGAHEREQMLNHLNWVHSHYAISNEDNIYTLLRMFMHPIEWIDKWSRRKLTPQERQALLETMLQLALDMNIQDMPQSYEAIQQWLKAYRKHHTGFAEANQQVARGMMKGLEQHFPRLMRPVIKPCVLVLLDDNETLSLLGYQRPGVISKVLVHGSLKAWKLYSKLFRPWKNSAFTESWFVNYFPSYAQEGGFSMCKLGPRKLVSARHKKGTCPFH